MKNVILTSILFTILIISCTMSGSSGSTPGQTSVGEYHVTPQGDSQGDGSINNPWDLQTALDEGNIPPNSNLYIHEGKYNGFYSAKLSGAPGQPITIGPYGNDHVIIDASGMEVWMDDDLSALSILGDWLIVRDLEITNSFYTRDDRTGQYEGIFPSSPGVLFKGANSKLINCIIHDTTSNGVSFWQEAENSEMYGNIIYYTGRQRDDRGAAHGLYTQNLEGVKTISQNIFFKGYQHNLHLYTEGGNIRNYRILENISFNAGTLENPAIGDGNYRTNFYLGGKGQPLINITMNDNHGFQDIYKAGKNTEIGYSGVNRDISLTGNRIISLGNGSAFINTHTSFLTFHENTVVTGHYLMNINPYSESTAAYQVDNNRYYGGGGFIYMGGGADFSGWKNSTAWDSSSHYSQNLPQTNDVCIQPNQYEEGRATVVIYNWEEKNEVSMDPSSILSPGQFYFIYDVESLYSGDIQRGTYGGEPIDIPMNLTSVSPTMVSNPGENNHTSLNFGVYLIMTRPLPIPLSHSSSPIPRIYYSPASPQVGESIQMDGSGSSSTGGEIVSYQWNFHNGQTAQGPSPSVVYNSALQWPVSLVVEDRQGNQSCRMIQIPVGQ